MVRGIARCIRPRRIGSASVGVSEPGQIIRPIRSGTSHHTSGDGLGNAIRLAHDRCPTRGEASLETVRSDDSI